MTFHHPPLWKPVASAILMGCGHGRQSQHLLPNGNFMVIFAFGTELQHSDSAANERSTTNSRVGIVYDFEGKQQVFPCVAFVILRGKDCMLIRLLRNVPRQVFLQVMFQNCLIEGTLALRVTKIYRYFVHLHRCLVWK